MHKIFDLRRFFLLKSWLICAFVVKSCLAKNAKKVFSQAAEKNCDVATREDVVGALALIGRNEVGVVDRGHGDKTSHLGLQLLHQVKLEDPGTIEALIKGKLGGVQLGREASRSRRRRRKSRRSAKRIPGRESKLSNLRPI